MTILPALVFTLAQVAPGPATRAPEVHLPWLPFRDPVDLHAWWWVMILPLSIGIAVVYKAVRMRDLGGWGAYWRQVALMTVQIILGMALLAAATYTLVEVFARYLAEHAPR